MEKTKTPHKPHIFNLKIINNKKISVNRLMRLKSRLLYLFLIKTLTNTSRASNNKVVHNISLAFSNNNNNNNTIQTITIQKAAIQILLCPLPINVHPFLTLQPQSNTTQYTSLKFNHSQTSKTLNLAVKP